MKTKKHQLIETMLAAVVLTSCGGKSTAEGTGSGAVKVETMQVAGSGADALRSYSGTVEEENGTLLSFATSGTVDGVYIKDGESVGKGRLIATLDPTQARNMHNAALAALTQAEDAWRRMKELYDKGSLPEIKWIEAQTTLQQARSAEKMAAKSLADCRLYAPFTGVISQKNVERGQNVMPGTPVAKLVTVDRLKVKIAVPENEISQIAVGQKASVSIAALGGEVMTGTVTEKGVTADPMSRAYDVKITLRNNGRKMMPGMVAEVSIRRQDEAATCIIPAHIVQIDENNNEFVWLAVGGKAVKRIITCGDFTASGVTVTSGLAAGDNIIVAGQHKVSNGTRVK